MNPFTIRLNFHGDLNCFIRPKTPSASVERTLAGKVSIKDVIESCGVPHPEVDLILLNGHPVEFGHALERSGNVDVYPVGTQPPCFKKNRLQAPTYTRFIVDGHLGKLTRNLRLLGFDVAYDPHAQDQQLLEIMASENRALLTRDRRLLMHSVVRHGYCPRSQHADAQTIEVVRRFNLFGSIDPFTRCVRCNGHLEKVAKSDVIEKLEPLTKLYYKEFRRCTGCGQIYWAGSHFSKLQKRLETIQAQSL